MLGVHGREVLDRPFGLALSLLLGLAESSRSSLENKWRFLTLKNRSSPRKNSGDRRLPFTAWLCDDRGLRHASKAILYTFFFLSIILGR